MGVITAIKAYQANYDTLRRTLAKRPPKFDTALLSCHPAPKLTAPDMSGMDPTVPAVLTPPSPPANMQEDAKEDCHPVPDKVDAAMGAPVRRETYNPDLRRSGGRPITQTLRRSGGRPITQTLRRSGG